MIGAMRLARLMGVDLAEKQLLEVAAAFHDIGVLVERVGHEEAGCQIMASILPAFHFSENQISQIAGMIRATKLPQSPTTRLEAILADADLDILGRTADFWQLNKALRGEITLFDGPISDKEWYGSQYQFLNSHTFFTEAAQSLRQHAKEQNIVAMKKKWEQSLTSITPLSRHAVPPNPKSNKIEKYG
jgi:predicted metal-dependent HD superfamily phosphohydrolase